MSRDWRSRAACLDEDPELFYPIGETGPALAQIRDAKTVCYRCPVLDTCRDWAMDTLLAYGIAGGLTEQERVSRRRRESRARAAVTT